MDVWHRVRALPVWKLSLALLLLAAGGGFFMLRWFEHNQVYHPTRELEATGAQLGRPWEDVWFTTADALKLNGWFFPGQPDSPRAKSVVLICHGNGGNISHRLDTCQTLLGTGVSVFVFDYRGYGRSPGRPSEEGTYRDADAAYRWLRTKGFGPSQIVLYGESLGGGVAAELAVREPSAGLILLSTFTSIPDMGKDLYPWLPVHRLASIRYDTIRKLPRITVPVLIMHSKSDGLVGFAHAQRNYAAANQPKLFWEISGTHNDPVGERPEFAAGIEKFLTLVENRPAAPAKANTAAQSVPAQSGVRVEPKSMANE